MPTILEIAQEMAKLKSFKKMQRKVRFAFWGAEEAGLLGSQYYVDNLSNAQLANIYANLNFDMLGSPNYVRFVYDGDGSDSEPAGPPGSDAIEEIFTDYFTSQGLASAPTEFSGRSDYGPFIAEGVPAGGLFSGAEGVKTAEEAEVYGGTAGEWYDPCYHQACDNINNLSTKALSEMGDAAAHAVWTLAKSKSGLYPDGSRVAQKSAKKVALAQKGHSRSALTLWFTPKLQRSARYSVGVPGRSVWRGTGQRRANLSTGTDEYHGVDFWMSGHFGRGAPLFDKKNGNKGLGADGSIGVQAQPILPLLESLLFEVAESAKFCDYLTS